MFSNYLTIALRSLLKSKVHSIINILGLAFGIACVFLITIYVQEELSYDRFHDKAENLYRITWEDSNPQTRTPHPMAQALKNDFPEIEQAVSITPLYTAGLTRETHSFRNPKSDRRYDEKNVLAVDTTFFGVFTFPLLRGNAKDALKNVNGILISESLAKKYFPDEDPMGKHLAVDSEEYLVEVVGVFKDVPANSHFNFDILVSYLREKSFDSLDVFYSWADFGHYNYIRLRDGADPKALEEKIMPWMRKHIDISAAQYEAMVSQGFGFRLQPVTDIHLYSRLRWELGTNGNIEYVYILSAAALLTLIIACVNFMNLTTAKSAERAKEIGVRKTMGAGQLQISLQFLAESVVTALISIAVAILIMEVTMPFFNSFTGLAFQIDYFRDGLMLFVLGLCIGVLSGLYPAFYLSNVSTQAVLKGKIFHSPRGAGLRKGLTGFQFFMSMVLVCAAVVIYSQLKYLGSKSLGFQKEEILIIPVKNESGIERFEALQNELSNIGGIVSVSASSNIPGGQFNQHHIAAPEMPEARVSASEVFVDYDFFSTLNIAMAGGRTFSRRTPSDSINAFVINETAAKELNMPDPVGKEILWIQMEGNRVERGTVIGVVKDFHFQSLHEPIRPLVFLLTQRRFNHIVLKADTEQLDNRLAAIEKVYREFEPVYAFEFAFLEDRLNAQYAAEKRTIAILTLFTVIAILIAAFGLFGMSLLTFQQKIKEFSVRKVLGATLPQILILQVGDFTRLILIAVIAATPVAWWVMDNWLRNFTYRVTIHPMIFVVSGIVLLMISWITLSYFSIKASQLNPAETLKNE